MPNWKRSPKRYARGESPPRSTARDRRLRAAELAQLVGLRAPPHAASRAADLHDFGSGGDPFGLCVGLGLVEERLFDEGPVRFGLHHSLERALIVSALQAVHRHTGAPYAKSAGWRPWARVDTSRGQ